MYQSVLPTKLTELGMADSSYFQTHKALRMLSKSIGKTVCVLTSHRLEIVKVVFGDSMKEANSKLVSKMNDLATGYYPTFMDNYSIGADWEE